MKNQLTKNSMTLTQYINKIGNAILDNIDNNSKELTASMLESFLNTASDKAEELEKN